MNKLGAVIVAAGRGTRMGTRESKQYLQIGDKPILAHTLLAFEQASAVDEIVLVVGRDDVSRVMEYKERYGLRKLRNVVAGGDSRQHSVYNGLKALSAEWVLVHDGVRPFVTEALIERCYAAAQRYGGAVAAVPVKDTIKVVDDSCRVTETPERARLRAVQTPQAFRRDELIAAHEAAFSAGFIGTDDASVAERYGLPVYIAEGEYTNVKITTPEDLVWAQGYLRSEGGRA